MAFIYGLSLSIGIGIDAFRSLILPAGTPWNDPDAWFDGDAWND